MKTTKTKLRILIREVIDELYGELNEKSSVSESNDWGIEWTEFNNRDRLVGKKKFFKTEKDRTRFIDKLEKKNNFNQVMAYSDPELDEMTTTADVAGYDAPFGAKLKDIFKDDEESR